MVSNWFFLPVVVGLLLLVSCVQAAPVTDGLVVYYDGNLSGNSLIDLSGNNNIGYATNVTQGTNQSTGANYITFNGLDSKIDVSNNTQTNISSPISIEFFGSVNNFSKYSALVSKYDVINNNILGWYLSSSSENPYNHVRFGTGLTDGTLHHNESNVGLVSGQVYDIVATYDNNTTHIYVNGVDSGSSTWDLPIAGINKNITIGHGSGLNYYNGSMYAFRLYNRSLSQAEVLQNYNFNIALKPGLPVANFSSNVTEGYAPLTVQFTDLSENADTVAWDFENNGVIDSEEQNPTHEFTLSGTYTVNLTASNENSKNSKFATIIVSEKPASVLPVTDGLIVYYDGNLSGNSLVDLSGNNNIGYATNITQGTNQSTGTNYVTFNGIDSKIDVSNNAQTNISSPISIEFIGSVNNFSKYSALVSKYGVINNNTLGWYLSSSYENPFNHARFGAHLTDGTLHYKESDINLVSKQVYDIVITYDNNTTHIYVDGVDSGSGTWNLPIEGINKNITIGHGSGLNYCNGSMYAFRLYNRSLSQAEVLQNYRNWISYDNNITMIKKLVYGNHGLPRYMGSYAIQQSDSGLNILDNNLKIYSSVGTPFFQNNGGSLTDCSLVETTVNGIKWRNCYAPGSSAILTYTGDNRSVQETCLLSNDSFNLNHSVTYLGQVQTVQDGVPVNGSSAFEYYGDGLNTISEKNVMLYTDNANIQFNLLYNSSGQPVTSKYQTRNASVTRTSSLELPLSSPQLSPMPVPYGHLGALIFAEHADFTDHDSLQTVIYGTNDTTNPNYGKKGFIGHNLTATWSVFAVSSASGEGLDSSALKSVTDNMSNHGFEIIPHTFSGIVGDDIPNRGDTETYLPWYVTNYSCRNWIDHGLSEGARNAELKSLGWDPASTYYIMDLFQNYNISYAWSFYDKDLKAGSTEISTSKIKSVGLPVDIVWQNTNLAFPNGTSLYQWKSCYATNQTALNYYTNSSINNMLSNYGVSIWHDYWPDNSTHHNYTDYYYIKGRPNMINATFDSLLTNISEQKQAGKLWNPTVSQYIDYWIAAKNVEVRCTGVNTYTVVNHNPDTVNGFSMRVTGSYTPKLDGVILDSKTNGEDTIFWTNLPTGMHDITLETRL